MKFTSFHIENFRGVKNLNIRFDRLPELNVFTLVGLNESGKSTILHALHWLRVPSAFDANDIIPKAYRANFNGTISVSADVSVSDADNTELARVVEAGGYVKTNRVEQFTITRRFHYENSTRTKAEHTWDLGVIARKKKGKKEERLQSWHPVWKSVSAHIEEHMLPPVVYYENFLFDIPDRIYLERASGKLNRDDIQYRDVLQDVLTSLNMGLTIDQHLLARHRNGERSDLENIQAVLDDAGAQLTDVVISAWREIVKNSDQKLEVTLGQGLEEDDTGIFLQLKVKEGKHTFYIRERSLGFRWFFGFILFTHFRTYRDNSRRNALFLLDEPASNLHPAAQTKLLSAFAALPNNQLVMYSTHSHHMITPKWLGGAFVVWNAGHSYDGLDLSYNALMTDVRAEQYFSFVAHHPKDTDLYRPILDALDYRPGPLEKVPDVVIVEGKNDYYTMKYAVEVLHLGGDEKLHIFPSTGKDKTQDIVAQYIAWGKNYLVLLDGDKGGRQTAERLKREFGFIAQDRIITLADIDPQWDGFAMEDMFTRVDQDLVTAAAFPGEKYTKSKFNTALATLLLQEHVVALSAGSTKNLRRIISFAQHSIYGDASKPTKSRRMTRR